MGPRWLQDHPKSSQNLSKMPPGPPKMAPRSPNWSQDGPRTPLTWSQDASQDLQLEDKNQSRSNKTKTSKQSTTYNSQWARPVAAAGAVDPAAPLIVLRATTRVKQAHQDQLSTINMSTIHEYCRGGSPLPPGPGHPRSR